MTRRPCWFALLISALAGAGCLPATAPRSSTSPAPPSAAAVTPKGLSVVAGPAEPTPADGVTLENVKFATMLSRIAANKAVKYTMVDAWATWCAPCKENFPHVVAMNRKYAGKGLAVISLSFDDPERPKQVEEARQFLREQKASFTNFLLDEEEGVGFEKLNIMGIPAVFVYGPDGKEVKRFTGDDPNHQFTYDDVEATVAALLEGKPEPVAQKAATAPK